MVTAKQRDLAVEKYNLWLCASELTELKLISRILSKETSNRSHLYSYSYLQWRLLLNTFLLYMG